MKIKRLEIFNEYKWDWDGYCYLCRKDACEFIFIQLPWNFIFHAHICKECFVGDDYESKD